MTGGKGSDNETLYFYSKLIGYSPGQISFQFRTTYYQIIRCLYIIAYGSLRRMCLCFTHCIDTWHSIYHLKRVVDCLTLGIFPKPTYEVFGYLRVFRKIERHFCCDTFERTTGQSYKYALYLAR